MTSLEKKHQLKLMDGSEAVANIAYRLTDTAMIFPITPSSVMAELYDEWMSADKKNLYGDTPRVVQMQSEAGAAGALHGALQMGSMATTFTASQGLLLMIPNMYKIAGELTPCVMHVAARTIATHALSIFGDHSDLASVRQTGWAMMGGSSPQEAHDMAAIAHVATLETQVPIVHFIDGWRVTHEFSKVDLMTDEQLTEFMDWKALARFRDTALIPEKAAIRGSSQQPDVFFQAAEAANPYYNAALNSYKSVMKRFGDITGRFYSPIEYYGSPDAENIIVVMGSGGQTIREYLDFTNNSKNGLILVRVVNPFPAEDFSAAIPKSAKRVAVLDRCKSPGMLGEPLYMDTIVALKEQKRNELDVCGGRYGLSSKEFTPDHVHAVYEMLATGKLKHEFTVGINDDVTHLSLEPTGFKVNTPDITTALVYGMGGDGLVGAGKNILKTIDSVKPEGFVQGYAVYDSKKAGSVTTTHLRLSDKPIRAPYLVTEADIIVNAYFPLMKKQNIAELLKTGGTLILNSPYGEKTFDELALEVQETLIAKKANVYYIDAAAIARQQKILPFLNSIMMTAFFKLTTFVDSEKALGEMKAVTKKAYSYLGEQVVANNLGAIEAALSGLKKITLPETLSKTSQSLLPPLYGHSTDFVATVTSLILQGKGDQVPVSFMTPGGQFESGTTKLEKRNIGTRVPIWDPEICIQCGRCAFVCPHAAIRAGVTDEDHLKDAPEGYESIAFKGREVPEGSRYTIQVTPMDCTGCNMCVTACPAVSKTDPSHKAINMTITTPEIQKTEQAKFDFMVSLPYPERSALNPLILKNTQMMEPYFEFSGACAGCGETPYIKLVTQLFGDHMVVANATGCTSIYGGTLPTTPWAKDARGFGPAWSNSLYEDAAEYGYGMVIVNDIFQKRIRDLLEKNKIKIDAPLVDMMLAIDQRSEAGRKEFMAHFEDLKTKIENLPDDKELNQIKELINYLRYKSMWIMGGDGWAYDIGYAGIDHIIHTNADFNILIVDTEGYSNTGGQNSKATPMGATMKFAMSGKKVAKKDLGAILMANGGVYVAQIAMYANPTQTIRAILEAESYPGPAVIIAHSPCIEHKYVNQVLGDGFGYEHQIAAVKSGEWPLYRYDPRLLAQGKPALQLDSKVPEGQLRDFMMSEGRFKQTFKRDAEAFEKTISKAELDLKQHVARHEYYSTKTIETNVEESHQRESLNGSHLKTDD